MWKFEYLPGSFYYYISFDKPIAGDYGPTWND